MGFDYTRRVGWTEVDPSGNYQFTSALRYVEEAEIALLRELGILDVLFPRMPRTFVRADFRSPARFEDVVTVSLEVGRVGRSSVEYAFRIASGTTLCASGMLGSAYLGDDGRSAPLPGQARQALEAQVQRDVPAGAR